MSQRVEKTLVIKNDLGLHIRTAGKLVGTANRFQASVKMAKDDYEVDGKSIMGVLTLIAPKGTEILFTVCGEDALECMEAIERLIESRFDETGGAA